MKRLLTLLLALAIFIPSTVQATPVSWDYTTNLLQPLQSGWSALVKGSYFQATSTSAVNRFPNALFTNASSTNATTSALDITSLLTFNGVTGSTWAAFCTAITGGAGLCDGTDASGSGSSAVATSSAETATYVPFWTSTGATPAALSGGESTFAYDSTLNKLTISNASTTALSIGSLTNILKQSGGVVIDAVADTDYQVPLTFGDGLTRTVNDVDCDTANGSTFGCLASADWTTFNNKVAGTRALTVAGTANQITSSAGAQDLSADRTWTLSLPSHVIFPSSFQVTSATTTNATTTGSQYITPLGTAAGAFLAIDPDGKVIATTSPSSGGITAIGPTGQTSDGPTVTFATSSGATNGLTPSLVITGSGDTQTFTSSISGTLTVAGGGTGVGTFTSSQLLYGNGTAALSSVATTTLSGGSQVAVSNSPVVIGATPAVLSIVADSIGDTQLAFNTGQTLTTLGTPTFAGLTNSALTAGRVTLAGTAGILTDDSTFLFDTTLDKLTTTNASTTNHTSVNATTTASLYITPLGTAAGTFVAADPTGKLIATTSPASGCSVNVQNFTATSSNPYSWSKPSCGTMVHVEVWGAGGSGGNGVAGAPEGGGGGGSYVERWIAYSSLGSTESVTVGAGGSAQASGSAGGNAGANSSFGSGATLVTAYGGGAGGANAAGGGGGGGGGGLSVGANGSAANGAAGGGPAGGAGGASAGTGGVSADGYGGGGGGGGGSSGTHTAGFSAYGGGGGGGGTDGGDGTGVGGKSIFGGGGGGGAGETNVGAAGGTSVNGGAGSAGTSGGAASDVGAQPGGGSGGTEGGGSGAGGAGKVRVTTY